MTTDNAGVVKADLRHKLLIDGELVDGDETLDVVNPATGQVGLTVPRASVRQLELAIAAAKRAFPAWAATLFEERRARVRQLADALDAHAEAIAQVLITEQGKPISEARGEVEIAAFFIRGYSDIELPEEVLQDDEQVRVVSYHRPLGVVAGITPWNFPLLASAMKLAMAVLTGNTFVLKPAPTTPANCLMLGELAREIFPAGVVNVIVDANDLGACLSAHADVAKVSFTGSTVTGKKVLSAAAPQLKRLTLELGGNDAAIVLGDVDVDTVARKLYESAFWNAGQVCIAAKRIYAHSAVYDQLCDALARLANASVVGPGSQEGTHIGPLQNGMQYRKAQKYLEVARRDGRIIAGGETVGDRGYFVRPTIVRDIAHESALVQEEQFAPILPVVRFDDVEDAVRQANDSRYGLGASVWSSDTERAQQIARRIESGTVWVNQHSVFTPQVPVGGAKESGMGFEHGAEGLAENTQKVVLSIAKQ